MKKTTILSRILYLPTVFILLILMAFQCGRENMDPKFDFDINIQLYPEQVTYKVGDTITLKYKIVDNSLKDTRTGNDILLGNMYLPLRMYFGKRHADSKLMDSSNVFSTVINNVPDSLIRIKENGQYTDFRYHLDCETVQGFYVVEILCVLQKAGIYKIEVWGSRGMEFSGNEDCSQKVYDPLLANLTYKFDVNRTNFELMEQSPLPPNVINITDYPEEEKTMDKGIYWIKVEY